MKKTFYTDVLPAIVLSLLMISAISYLYLRSSKNYQATFVRTQEIQTRIDNVDNIYTLLVEMESGLRGYIFNSDSTYASNYEDNEKQILQSLQDDFFEKDGQSQPILDSLKYNVGQKLSVMRGGLNRMKAGNRDSILIIAKKGRGKMYMARIKDLVTQIHTIETHNAANSVKELQAASGQNFMAILVGLFITLTIFSYWAWKLTSSNALLSDRNDSLGASQLTLAETNTQLNKTKNELEQVNDNLEQIIDDRTKALYESEARLRSLADFIPQFVWRCEPDGALEYANKQWIEYSGLKLKELSGFKWLNTIYHEDVEHTTTAWKHSLDTGAPFEVEYRLCDKTGGCQWFLGRAFPTLDVQGNIVNWFGTCTNIEEQKNERGALESKVNARTADLLKLNEELLRSNAELEQFAYVASHDLQEPLRKIHAFGERLEMKYHAALGEEGVDFLNRMRSASTRMQVLIDDLLNFSRVSRVKNPFQPINLNQIIGEVLMNMEESITTNNATINSEQLPTILGDQSQLMQLFQNILSNALKFKKPDVLPVIDIKYHEATSEEVQTEFGFLSPTKYYILTISDNGIGFDAKYTEKIFTIFQRLHGRNEYPGTGIGLAIVRKVAENHGGRIKATGELGEGAIFMLLLPQA